MLLLKYLEWSQISLGKGEVFRWPWPSRKRPERTSCYFLWELVTTVRTRRTKNWTGEKMFSESLFLCLCRYNAHKSVWRVRGCVDMRYKVLGSAVELAYNRQVGSSVIYPLYTFTVIYEIFIRYIRLSVVCEFYCRSKIWPSSTHTVLVPLVVHTIIDLCFRFCESRRTSVFKFEL